MDKFEKAIAVMLVLVTMFIIGYFVGEKNVFEGQQIYSNESGYTVIYRGHEYKYN